VKAQLERREALFEVALGGIRLRCRLAQGPGGGVGAHAARQAAEEFPAGGAEDLAGEVPECKIQRPAAPVVEIDVGQHPVVTLERERVLTDEE
jgi:hypothetical protein